MEGTHKNSCGHGGDLDGEGVEWGGEWMQGIWEDADILD